MRRKLVLSVLLVVVMALGFVIPVAGQEGEVGRLAEPGHDVGERERPRGERRAVPGRTAGRYQDGERERAKWTGGEHPPRIGKRTARVLAEDPSGPEPLRYGAWG